LKNRNAQKYNQHRQSSCVPAKVLFRVIHLDLRLMCSLGGKTLAIQLETLRFENVSERTDVGA
jgi:hypothetical protein